MHTDIHWFIRTCCPCQLWQIHNILIPPVVATPAPLFGKMYVNTMHMPKFRGFRYIVQGRCSLLYYVKFHMLHGETEKTLGDWLFEDVVCRWGGLFEIVSDNRPPFVKVLKYLLRWYHINHIQISGYNSRTNSLVKRSHFDVWQALFKLVDRDQTKWSKGVYSLFWADRITIYCCMGCLPYFSATGVHPLLSLDITEAMYLLPPPMALICLQAHRWLNHL